MPPAAAGRRLRPGTLPWLLHRNLEDLRPLEQEQLSQDLEQDQRLRTDWMLKEGLRSVYKWAGLEQATRRLDFWLRDARESSLEPFQRLARTLSAWREQILNYWRYPLTNALVEGKHNRVKVLKRRAYGYRSDGTFLLAPAMPGKAVLRGCSDYLPEGFSGDSAGLPEVPLIRRDEPLCVVRAPGPGAIEAYGRRRIDDRLDDGPGSFHGVFANEERLIASHDIVE